MVRSSRLPACIAAQPAGISHRCQQCLSSVKHCTRYLKQEPQLLLCPSTWIVKLLRAKLALCGYNPGHMPRTYLMAPHNPGQDAEPRFHDKPMKLHSFCELLRSLLGVASPDLTAYSAQLGMSGIALQSGLPEGLASDLLAHVGVDGLLRHSRCADPADVDCHVARLMSLMDAQLEAHENSAWANGSAC